MRAFVLSLALLAGCSGCFRNATPEAQERLRVFECQVAALEPIVEPVFNAAELVRDAYGGVADIDEVLAALQTSQLEAASLKVALQRCRPLAAPDAVQSKVIAPPPAYGNKIL